MAFSDKYLDRISDVAMSDVTYNAGTTAATIVKDKLNAFSGRIEADLDITPYEDNAQVRPGGDRKGMLARSPSFSHDGSYTPPEATIEGNDDRGMVLEWTDGTADIISGPFGGSWRSHIIGRGKKGDPFYRVMSVLSCKTVAPNVLQKVITITDS